MTTRVQDPSPCPQFRLPLCSTRDRRPTTDAALRRCKGGSGVCGGMGWRDELTTAFMIRCLSKIIYQALFQHNLSTIGFGVSLPVILCRLYRILNIIAGSWLAHESNTSGDSCKHHEKNIVSLRTPQGNNGAPKTFLLLIICAIKL